MFNTFVITGRPGSGKTVQAKLLAKETEFIHFSPGDEYREVASRETQFGLKIKELIDDGDLGPEWFSIYLFQKAVLDLSDTDGIIFSGTGRRKDEAECFHNVMSWLSRRYSVFNIVVSEKESSKRLSLRRTKENREDDEEKDIPIRMNKYKMHTKLAIDFFRSAGVLIDIDGEQSIEEVHKDILKELGM
ncbi:MAG TPA: hypothetical protein ENI63_00185 [Candidatus Kaiserbacteria bacterium]|nr:hypothetical protein [Candidatus Kaiserbacteria bacterium]